MIVGSPHTVKVPALGRLETAPLFIITEVQHRKTDSADAGILKGDSGRAQSGPKANGTRT